MDLELRKINLEDLRESKLNPRRHFNEAALDELAASIQQVGVLTPLTVRAVDGYFEIGAGARRFRAAKQVGLAAVPAIVRAMDDVEFLEFLVIENAQRADVHPLEEGHGYRALFKAGYTVERIAERIGRSADYVYERLKLLDLIKEAREVFLDGKIHLSHARLLAHLSPADQLRALAPPTAFKAGPLFEFDAQAALEEQAGKTPRPIKARSKRELERWIEENCRLDPRTPDAKAMFPETAGALEVAEEQAEKIVAITRSYLAPSSPEAGRILTARTWKRADGHRDPYDDTTERPKTCEASRLGVVVIGPGRGEAFRVCADKDCETHWGKDQRERAKAAEAAAKNPSEEAKTEAQARRWAAARPWLLETIATRVQIAPVRTVGEVVLAHMEFAINADVQAAIPPRGKTAESILRRAAFLALAVAANSATAFRAWADAFGIDLDKVLREAPDAN